LEPAAGKIIFGAWLDNSNAPVSGGDTPLAYNSRIGFNAGAFQLWQNLPPRPVAEAPASDYAASNHNPDGTIDLTGLNDKTNAAVFLTVYPLGLTTVTDDHLTALGNQCNQIINSTRRNVFIRLAPEMNGEWFVYGKQPDAFIALWKRAYTIVTKISPTVAFVWSPNFDGPRNDEPYAPYWPGADYVDWVGVSVYWKGSVNDYPWIHNTNAPSNYVAQIIDAAPGPEGGPISFYQQYAVKYNKPFVISECASTFHIGTLNADGTSTALDAGIGRTQTIMSFWNSFLFNPTFLANYPLLKMVFAFEMYKVEDNNTQNDYRASVEPTTLAAFSAGLKQLDSTGVVQWAQAVVPTTVTTAAPTTAAATGVVVNTAVTAAPGNAAAGNSKSSAMQCGSMMGFASLILSLCL
ncbi:hypothetical protein HDU99_007292, partial [Rhizoclosmatium hyalinum]